MICVKIDTANLDSIKILNEKYYIFLRIENGIASFSIPSSYRNLDSVSVNMNNNRKEQFYEKGHLLGEYPLSFSYAYLREKKLEHCFQ